MRARSLDYCKSVLQKGSFSFFLSLRAAAVRLFFFPFCRPSSAVSALSSQPNNQSQGLRFAPVAIYLSFGSRPCVCLVHFCFRCCSVYRRLFLPFYRIFDYYLPYLKHRPPPLPPSKHHLHNYLAFWFTLFLPPFCLLISIFPWFV